MDAALPANSRVIIECTDPVELLPVLEPFLLPRLPLRNLHWKSPNRPLRSIDVLNVGFTRTDDGQSNSTAGPRRHQIPGLRQTPFVKIFLLRCDDKETYKEYGRKQVRHWIKSNTPVAEGKKSSSNQEHHDAFEWLIVHVVLPETAAANEPRTSKHASLGTTDSTESVGGKSKWPGKSSSTIYEKLLADFNSSSKSSIDRVAQVRIPRIGPTKHSSVLAPAEIEEQWQDLVEKLKVTILASFDTRVAQYEEDIRERDSQRGLPGWNFCTFFMLKEGLSRGFENVGLLEDAMIGYDELAAGLDAVVKEQAMRDEGDQGTLLQFSKDMKDKIRSALDDLRIDEQDSAAETSELSKGTLLNIGQRSLQIDTRRKDYRGLILGNEVSALDLRTYIFARQLELLRRRANAQLTTSKDTGGEAASAVSMLKSENLSMLAEVGTRGVRFINLGARAMRRDLYRAWGGQEGLTGQDLRTQKAVIDNVVFSWTWNTALQLLSQTQTSALDLPDDVKAMTASLANGSIKMLGQVGAEDGNESLFLPDQDPGGSNSDQDMFLLETYTGKTTVSSVQSTPLLSEWEPAKSAKTGSAQLASSRAEIMLLARNVVEALGSKKGHLPMKNSPDWNDSADVGINGKQDDKIILAGLEEPVLKDIASNPGAFLIAYETLTDLACRHFLAANKFKSAERAVVDLALLKYQAGDHQSATDYFGLVANFYGKGAWGVLTESVLESYADCLTQLGRREEHVRCLLSILTGAAQQSRSSNPSVIRKENIQQHLDDLRSSSNKLESKTNVPLLTFFEVDALDGCVQHFDDRDGFHLTFSIRLRLDAKVEASDSILLSLVALDGEGPPKKLSLKTTQSVTITGTFSSLRFESKVTAHGLFEFSTLELDIGKIHFQFSMKDLRSSHLSDLLSSNRGLAQFRRPVLLYPASRSVNVKALADPFISLGQPRKISVQIESNDNEIRDCKISTKAATAGLRLRIHDAELIEHDDSTAKLTLDDDQDIRLADIKPGRKVKFNFPYTLENAETMLLVANLQLTYKTPGGTFVYYDTISISTILPISVNVQEVFKAAELYSRFTVSPATLVPLRLRSCSIDGGVQYDVSSGLTIREPFLVFPKQPASLLYKIKKRSAAGSKGKAEPLPLIVDYECIDEIVLSVIEARFVADVRASRFSHLSRLLTSHLLLAYTSKWTEQDLEVSLLLGEIELWPYEEIGWEDVLRGLNRETQKEVIAWLQSWHLQWPAVGLASSAAPVRRISIPIEIPTPRVVVSAALKSHSDHRSSVATMVNQPLLISLHLSFTDHWRRRAEDSEEGDASDFDFSYEIVAPPEHWLIGGRRKGNFSAGPDEQHTFQMLLLPQKPGHLMYPTVDVKCFEPGTEKEIRCETDYQSQAMSILVIPGLKSTTVAIDEDAAAGSSWLISSETMSTDR